MIRVLMKNKNLLSIMGLVFAIIVPYKFLFKKTESIILPKYAQYLSCNGTPKDLNVSFKSDIYFLKSAMPLDPKERNTLIIESIFHQNLYTFMNLGQINSILINSSNLGNRPVIKLISETEETYPSHPAFETEQEIFFFGPEKQKYLTQIFPNGEITKGEPAIKVSYEYKNELQLCLNSSDMSGLQQLEFLQPKDPLFSYFIVSPSDRRPLENKSWKSSASINPCMDPAAIGGGRVAPFAFWYHWQPRAKGKDLQGNAFDCESIYNDDVVNKVKVTFSENEEKKTNFIAFSELDNLNRPIKASLLLGAHNNYSFEEFNEDEVSKLINLYISGLSVEDAKKNLPYFKQKYDPGFSTLLIVLWNMTKHIKLHSIELQVDRFFVSVNYRGKLNLSKKDIELKMSFARNRPGMEGSEYFNKTMANAITQDDIVIYVGHAGYGSMFDGALKMLKSDESQKLNEKLKYQILALYSCSSQFYFHPSIFPKGKGGMKRDIITSGGGYNDPTGQASIALIGSLDSYLYNESYVPFGLWSKQFKINNFLILSNN